MPASLDPQLALDERALNAPDLEAALERRLRAQDDVAEARGVYKTAHAEVQAELDKLDDFDVDTALRVGRFRIVKRSVEARHVEFDAAATERLTIGLVDDDGKAVRRPRAEKVASVSDDEDLRPTGEVNPDELRGIAERSSIPEPGGRNAGRNASRGPLPPVN